MVGGRLHVPTQSFFVFRFRNSEKYVKPSLLKSLVHFFERLGNYVSFFAANFSKIKIHTWPIWKDSNTVRFKSLSWWSLSIKSCFTFARSRVRNKLQPKSTKHMKLSKLITTTRFLFLVGSTFSNCVSMSLPLCVAIFISKKMVIRYSSSWLWDCLEITAMLSKIGLSIYLDTQEELRFNLCNKIRKRLTTFGVAKVPLDFIESVHDQYRSS